MDFWNHIHPILIPRVSSTGELFTQDGDLDLSYFEDIEPYYPQSHGQCFQILGRDKLSKYLAIFRRLMNTRELSKRALALTQIIIQYNPTDETVWWYRREILSNYDFSTDRELGFINSLYPIALKTYQIWKHRLWVIEHLKEHPKNFDSLKDVLEMDTRNFHVWNYVRKVADLFGLYFEAAEFARNAINADHSNNSAWSLLAHILFDKEIKMDGMKELEWALGKFSENGKNSAVAAFVRALVQKCPETYEKASEEIEKLIKKNQFDRATPALLFWIDSDRGRSDRAQLLAGKMVRCDHARAQLWRDLKDNKGPLSGK